MFVVPSTCENIIRIKLLFFKVNHGLFRVRRGRLRPSEENIVCHEGDKTF